MTNEEKFGVIAIVAFIFTALGIWNGVVFWPDPPLSAATGIAFGSMALGAIVGKALVR